MFNWVNSYWSFFRMEAWALYDYNVDCRAGVHATFNLVKSPMLFLSIFIFTCLLVRWMRLPLLPVMIAFEKLVMSHTVYVVKALPQCCRIGCSKTLMQYSKETQFLSKHEWSETLDDVPVLPCPVVHLVENVHCCQFVAIGIMCECLKWMIGAEYMCCFALSCRFFSDGIAFTQASAE